MNKIISMVTVVLFGVTVFGVASAQTKEEKIAQAVLPLPEELRAGAAVYDYTDEGQRLMLRGGSNHVESPFDSDMWRPAAHHCRQ